jgi:ribonuclease R
VVSAVTNFGLFVELKDLYIEGLVHITNLPGDYYRFDHAQQRLVGERSGRSYQLGASLRVLVAAVNLDERKIDLEPVDEKGATQDRGSDKKKRRRGGRGGGSGHADSGDGQNPSNAKKKPRRKSGTPAARAKSGGEKQADPVKDSGHQKKAGGTGEGKSGGRRRRRRS